MLTAQAKIACWVSPRVECSGPRPVWKGTCILGERRRRCGLQPWDSFENQHSESAAGIKQKSVMMAALAPRCRRELKELELYCQGEEAQKS